MTTKNIITLVLLTLLTGCAGYTKASIEAAAGRHYQCEKILMENHPENTKDWAQRKCNQFAGNYMTQKNTVTCSPNYLGGYKCQQGWGVPNWK